MGGFIMNKKEEFKLFMKKNPIFIKSVKEGKVTLQKLYEIYDIYGEKSEVWDNYRESDKFNISNSQGFKNIVKGLKSINIDNLQENLDGLQKAISFIEEVTNTFKKKDDSSKNNKKKGMEEVGRFFDD